MYGFLNDLLQPSQMKIRWQWILGFHEEVFKKTVKEEKKKICILNKLARVKTHLSIAKAENIFE